MYEESEFSEKFATMGMVTWVFGGMAILSFN